MSGLPVVIAPPHLANFVCSPGQWCMQNSERAECPCHVQMMTWALGNGEWPPCHHCPLTMLTSFAAQDDGAHRIPNERKAHATYRPCHVLPMPRTAHAMYCPPMPRTAHAMYRPPMPCTAHATYRPCHICLQPRTTAHTGSRMSGATTNERSAHASTWHGCCGEW